MTDPLILHGVSLSTAFERFLRARADPDARRALASALDGAYPLEAWLLERWGLGPQPVEVELGDHPWSGRSAWVGPVLPDRAAAGEIWLDVCEMMPMLLVGREPPEDPSQYAPGVLERLTPFVGWLALRPVARWQLGAFMHVARLAPRKVQVAPKTKPLDSRRLLVGPEDAPATRVLPDESGLYAGWFGKAIAQREDFRASSVMLAPAQQQALWSPLRGEWDGAVTEGIFSVVGPDSIDVDPAEAFDEDPELRDPHRILYGEFETPVDIGFRTRVSTQRGLGTGGDDPLSILDVRIRDSVDRR